MTNSLVRAQIEEIWVHFNGDSGPDPESRKLQVKKKTINRKLKKLRGHLRGRKKLGDHARAAALQVEINNLEAQLKGLKVAKDNFVIATLGYPRSGESKVLVSQSIHLESGEEAVIENRDESFLDNPFFKELVQGETTLQITVTDTDKNKLGKSISKIFTSLLGVLLKAPLDKIENTLVATGANEAKGEILKAIGSDSGDTDIIGKSKRVKIEIDEHGKIQVLNANEDGIEFNNNILNLVLYAPKDFNDGGNTIPKGSSNGEIELKLVGAKL